MSFIARLAASIFFPQFKTLGCDVDQTQTPAVLKKISLAAVRDRSYDKASRNLKDLAELDVSAKQVQRVAIRIGHERVSEQQQRIERYQNATLPEQQHGQPDDAPQNGWSGRAAVVQCDGGRAQIRDALWGEEKPAGKRHRWWRETQSGVLQTYLSKPSTEDPHPEVPAELTDPLWAVPRFNEIHRAEAREGSCDALEADEDGAGEDACEADIGDLAPLRESADTASSKPNGTAKADDKTTDPPRWSGGPPLVKTVVATRRGYDHLGLALAAEAYHRGFNKAMAKAFLGDGLKVNWTLWSRHFSHYTPIVDLMHALSYVYAAAVASSATIEDGWSLYLRWLGWVWAGQVPLLIEALEEIAADRAGTIKSLDRAITYLRNNVSRMHYDQYRRAGLPITTALVESTQKQINWRVKGTEKFWRDEHLEPLLQLVTDDLSDTYDCQQFWDRRRDRFTGFRNRRAKA
jgi:hypothetical protein